MHLIRRQSNLSLFSSHFYITLNIPVGISCVLSHSEASVLFNSRIRSLAKTLNWRSPGSHVLRKYFGVADYWQCLLCTGHESLRWSISVLFLQNSCLQEKQPYFHCYYIFILVEISTFFLWFPSRWVSDDILTFCCIIIPFIF